MLYMITPLQHTKLSSTGRTSNLKDNTMETYHHLINKKKDIGGAQGPSLLFFLFGNPY